MGREVTGLVGDVGGTHARFSIATAEGGRTRLAQTRVLQAADYPTGEAALEAYLKSLHGPRPKLAVIAAAGPIVNGAVSFTNNRAWRFSEARVGEACAIPRVRLINDFTAQALAIDRLAAADTRLLGPRGRPAPRATAAIVGPGTGFGAAALADDGSARAVITGEGGHIGFAPEDDVEIEIARRLAERYGRVSVERVLSGPGLLNLYQTLADMEDRPAPLSAPDEITRGGLAGEGLARAALARFCAILGSVAGDFALAMGARRGVYISGGIAPDILDFLKASDFRRRFESKGRMTAYLRAIPTRVVIQPHVALIGAAGLLDGLARPA
jgi:glucokinase